MYNFKDVYGYGTPFTQIHPYKQQAAKHIVDTKPDWVTHIIIFGSAIGTWHFYEKDLDVCLIGRDPEPIEERSYNYQRSMKQDGVGYDFLTYDTYEELLKHKNDINTVQYDILNEGVTVYAKG
jgi:hypothetical protein